MASKRSSSESSSSSSQTTTKVREGLFDPDVQRLSPFIAAQAGQFSDLIQNLVNLPAQQFPITSFGLSPENTAGFQTLFNQALSQASGQLAQRGFLRPQSAGAVAEIAGQTVLPAFAAASTQDVLQNVFGPRREQAARIGELSSAINTIVRLIGGEEQTRSTSTQTTSRKEGGFGFFT